MYLLIIPLLYLCCTHQAWTRVTSTARWGEGRVNVSVGGSLALAQIASESKPKPNDMAETVFTADKLPLFKST